MKLIIPNKQRYKKEFIYNTICSYILSLFKESSDRVRLNSFNDFFGFKADSIILYALNNLSISETSDSYIIKIDKNLRFKNLNVDKCVNLITYGTREIKGCPIVLNIFNAIVNNLDTIYERWNSGR